MLLSRARCAAVTLLQRRTAVTAAASTKQSSAVVADKNGVNSADVPSSHVPSIQHAREMRISELREQAQQALTRLKRVPPPASPQAELASWEEELVPLAAGIVQNEALPADVRLSAAQTLLALHTRKDAAVQCTRSCTKGDETPASESNRREDSGVDLSCLSRPVGGNDNTERDSSGSTKASGKRKKFPGRQETSVHTTTEESVAGVTGDDGAEPVSAASEPLQVRLDPALLLPAEENQNSWGRITDVRGNVLRVGLESSVDWAQSPNEMVDGVCMVDIAYTCQQVDALEYQGLISGYDMVQIMDQIISATIDPVRCPGVLPKIVAMTKALGDASLERQLARQLKKEFVLDAPAKKKPKQGLIKAFVKEFTK